MSRRKQGAAAIVAALTILIVGCVGAWAAVNVSKSGWAWGNPSPQGNTLRAVAFSGSLGYAVGDGGTALMTQDGGVTWTGLATGSSSQLDRVQIINSTTVVVGSGNGCVLRISTNGGQSFTRIFTVGAESGCSNQVQAFSFVSPSTGYLLLNNGSVYVTTDGGNTFSRKTNIPSTSLSSGGGTNVGVDIHFTSPTSGIAFVGPSGGGQSAAYVTADGGTSWTQVTLPAAADVTSVHYVDALNAYAIGPNTLLRSTDGGNTWNAEPIAGGNSFSAIDCASDTTCVLLAGAGDKILRTTDGGLTSTTTTPSSSVLYGIGYASATRVVSVGVGGTTVDSVDGGVTYSAASNDIGGSYSRLRTGPTGLVYAPGTNGTFALSTDSGTTWTAISTTSSASLVDVAFATPTVGYALDASGVLQETQNAGTSWTTLNAATPRPAKAVAAISSNVVLLVGPVGIYRAVGAGAFTPVPGSAVAKAQLSDYDTTPNATFAFGGGTATLIVSKNGGATWAPVTLPLTNRKGKTSERIKSVAFATASTGWLLDTTGRVFSTRNGGHSWTEVLSTGTSNGTGLAFSGTKNGFLTLSTFAGDAGNAYVLRTNDGGVTWHPQLIATGTIPGGGIAVASPQDAYALVDGPALGGSSTTPTDRLLFSTQTGGDAGTASTLTITTKSKSLSKSTLKHAGYVVTINGQLKGALGGEQIVVSRRNLSGGGWQHQVVTAGANGGGSFTTNWKVTTSSVFVAQWAGDSGRTSLASKVLTLTVH